MNRLVRSAEFNRGQRRGRRGSSKRVDNDEGLCVVLLPQGQVKYTARAEIPRRLLSRWRSYLNDAGEGYEVDLPLPGKSWTLTGQPHGACFDCEIAYRGRPAMALTLLAAELSGARAWRLACAELPELPALPRPRAPWAVVHTHDHGMRYMRQTVEQLVQIPALLGWAWVERASQGIRVTQREAQRMTLDIDDGCGVRIIIEG